jgi:site-specific recombinase XerD
MHIYTLSTLIERFFCDYLRTQRNLSPHTVTAYADTFRLLLRFLSEHRRQPIDRLGFHDLDADSVLAFLLQLEKKRANTARTRNARLAAVRSFARYALGQSAPDWFESARRILAIPAKRTSKPAVGFMSREEVAAVLSAVDVSSSFGRRDHLLFSLLYQTGARISEILRLRPDDVHGRFVKLHGKGRKERTVPVQSQLVRQLQRFAQVKRRRSDQPLFTNRHGVILTREGVALRLDLAVRKAEQACPSLHGRRITPHVWRHYLDFRTMLSGG